MEQHLKLKDYLDCMARISRLDSSELAGFEKRLKAFQDRQARRALEESFLPAVVGWVSGYRGQGLPFESLIEMGNRALLRGLRRYHAAVPMGLEDYLEEKVRDSVEAALVAMA